jgi:hypothetical protein
MTLNDQIFTIYRRHGAATCQRFLDEHAPGKDREERRSLAHWRVVLLEKDGQYATALDVVNAGASDFNSQSLLAFEKARLLRGLGRVDEAIATLQAAPISEEVATFPGLAWEAAFFCGYLLVSQGEPPPQDLLDLIPDDFETMVDGRFVGKGDLVAGGR